MPQHVLPRTLVSRPGSFRRDPRRVVEELFDGDLRFARIAQRLGLWDEVERRVVERHLLCQYCGPRKCASHWKSPGCLPMMVVSFFDSVLELRSDVVLSLDGDCPAAPPLRPMGP